jgi:tryptophan synthase alpha chain
MSRLSARFEKLKAEGRKGLNIFISAGDPDLDKSLKVMKALPAAGADFIELGMPFTDPMADGPAVQASSLRALKSGASMQGTFGMLQQFRSMDHDTPVILMGYFNPVLSYGINKFVQDAASAGADGLIVVDLPPEEDAELRIPAQEAGLDFIKLVTPTTDDSRLQKILESASGFLYYVSITGVTGTKSADVTAVGRHIARIKTKTALPVAAGFGIKTPKDAAEMAKIADAVVVGSAIVETIKDHQDSKTLADAVAIQVTALKKALEL